MKLQFLHFLFVFCLAFPSSQVNKRYIPSSVLSTLLDENINFFSVFHSYLKTVMYNFNRQP